jgi:hypothetical protein
MKRTASNALVQVAAQGVMLQKFGEAIGKKLSSSQILLDDILVQIDGHGEADGQIVLAECWAHIGKAKVAQKHKIAADVLKLSLASFAIRKQHPDKAVQCYLVFADEDAADVVRSSSWVSAAARHYGIVPYVVQLDETTIRSIRAAQKAQDLRDDMKTKAAAQGAEE